MWMQLLGWVFSILSWPLILLGGVIFVLNIVLLGGGFPSYRFSLFINGALLAGLGYLFRLLGERFRRVRY